MHPASLLSWHCRPDILIAPRLPTPLSTRPEAGNHHHHAPGAAAPASMHARHRSPHDANHAHHSATATLALPEGPQTTTNTRSGCKAHDRRIPATLQRSIHERNAAALRGRHPGIPRRPADPLPRPPCTTTGWAAIRSASADPLHRRSPELPQDAQPSPRLALRPPPESSAAALACQAAPRLKTMKVVETGLRPTTFGREGAASTAATAGGSGDKEGQRGARPLAARRGALGSP
jgi:hypothetical protein